MKETFENLRKKLNDLVFDEDFCPSKIEGTIPKENCKGIISKNALNSNLAEKKS